MLAVVAVPAATPEPSPVPDLVEAPVPYRASQPYRRAAWCDIWGGRPWTLHKPHGPDTTTMVSGPRRLGLSWSQAAAGSGIAARIASGAIAIMAS